LRNKEIARAIAHLSKDKKLAPYIKDKMLKFDKPSYDVYEGLLSSIVSQQLSVKAAATIYSRFLELFDDGYPDPSILLKLETPILRSAGLSNQKSGYVKNVATYFTEHNIFDETWTSQSDNQIIKQLTEIKGVGRWTVEMILMFTLGRLDVMPLGDLGIQQAMADIYNLTSTKKDLQKEMLELSLQWSPYRTVACRYLWSYKDEPSSEGSL